MDQKHRMSSGGIPNRAQVASPTVRWHPVSMTRTVITNICGSNRPFRSLLRSPPEPQNSSKLSNYLWNLQILTPPEPAMQRLPKPSRIRLKPSSKYLRNLPILVPLESIWNPSERVSAQPPWEPTWAGSPKTTAVVYRSGYHM